MTRPSVTLEDSVCFAVYSAAQATVQLYRDLLAPWGVTYQQLLVLGILWRDESTSPGRIADELHLDASTITGSYAGAMGYGQFMPSSYRAYAVDSDGDGKRDIWNSRADAIGSVANYLSAHNWEKGAGVAIRLELDPEFRELPENSFSDMRPNMTGSQLLEMGFKVPSTHMEKTVALIRLRSDAESEYWLGEWNFYVITRYNRSPMYAMAVLQLAQALRIGKS